MRVSANLDMVNTCEGTHDVHALILDRVQTGIQAFLYDRESKPVRADSTYESCMTIATSNYC